MLENKKKIAVIAIGGNSLIRDKHHLKVEDQYQEIKKTIKHVIEVINAGYEVVITHGNGPQVGFILRRSEIAFQHEGLHFVPLESCVADTQGAIGYQIQQALNNEFKRINSNKSAVTLVTQVRVSKDDPDLEKPTKPIGSFYDEKQVKDIKKDHPDWNMISDAGRGYRRTVPSPKPIEIIEMQMIKHLVNQGCCVITAGGGGIPVMENKNGMLEGINAVIDKDYASALLAHNLNAELLIISTCVKKVCLNFEKKDEVELSTITVAETKKYIQEGHFKAGSMLPKIQAILWFLEHGGKKAIITKPDHLEQAVMGKSGTHIIDKSKNDFG